tara:strand:- start:2477 stop:2767 length:291 start_codon:yes stop_codon:yes gene_type:complete
MPAGKHKSRTFRRVKVKTPGGDNKIHYRKRKIGKLVCGDCGKQLHGIPSLIQSKFMDLPKTKKRPQRPFGGVLCSSCSRKEVVSRLDKILEKVMVK